MKKLLKVSLMAMLVAAPFAANAADIAAATKETVTPTADVASTSYVKGAYNAAIDEINTNRTQINANTTAIANKQAQLTNGTANVSETVKTSVGAASGEGAATDTALVTEKAVRDAITAATQATTYTAGSGLALNGNEFSASGITTSNIAADAAIAKTQLASDVQTSLGKADTALQNDSALNGANLTAGTVAETALAQGVQDKLAAADSALQATDLDNTTIEKDATNGVQVKAGSIGTTQLASGVVTSLGLADTALQSNSALNGANLTAGTVAETALDSALATKINNAAAAKKVTVHTTWGSDSTTAPADVLVNAN